MASFTKTLITASSALMLAGSAMAAAPEAGLTASFRYAPEQSVAENYAQFRQVATAACRSEYRDIVSLNRRARYERLCAADLLDQAVNGAGRAQLTALHSGDERPMIAGELAAAQ
ncbi:MAG: hypothetical protein AAF648_09065 [Pseudomonadota bacterium]